MHSPTDNELMFQIRDDDVAKLGILFERHHHALYNFFLHLTGDRGFSEDLVQEVFLRILKYRGTYRGDSEFTVWMYRIARNAWHDLGKKWHREKTAPTEDEFDPVSDDPLASDTMEKSQENALLRTALARLPSEKREVLILSRFQNLKYDEIAELMHCTVGTIKTRAHRAIKDLRKIFLELSKEKVA